MPIKYKYIAHINPPMVTGGVVEGSYGRPSGNCDVFDDLVRAEDWVLRRLDEQATRARITFEEAVAELARYEAAVNIARAERFAKEKAEREAHKAAAEAAE